jgi:hypothetical protein
MAQRPNFPGAQPTEVADLARKQPDASSDPRRPSAPVFRDGGKQPAAKHDLATLRKDLRENLSDHRDDVAKRIDGTKQQVWGIERRLDDVVRDAATQFDLHQLERRVAALETGSKLSHQVHDLVFRMWFGTRSDGGPGFTAQSDEPEIRGLVAEIETALQEGHISMEEHRRLRGLIEDAQRAIEVIGAPAPVGPPKAAAKK